MPNFKRGSFLLVGLFLLLVSGCNPAVSSSSEPINQSSSQQDVEPGAYYNEENFLTSTKQVTETKLVIYDGPEYLNECEKVDISVNNNDLFVYETRVNHETAFSWSAAYDLAPVAIFDFEGKVHVSITVKDASVTSAKVSPLVYGIVPTIENNVISFDLSYSDNYVIEYNDDSNTAIHLFANPIEEDPITEEEAKNDSSITYIGPGVYKADAISMKSNSTVYIAGGAYVYGQIRTEDLENITIRGRGIISGAIYERRSESEYTLPIEIRSSTNVRIEGITILDPAGWTITLYKSTDVVLDNVKIITARQNGDGISVQSCSNVLVKNGFVRSWDDSLVVKNSDRGSTNNVVFDDVTVWTDLAQSMEVGYETYGPEMNDITFKNITIVHNFHKAAISMHNCDDAVINNVTYENITLEDGQMLGDQRSDGENDFLIDFTIAYHPDWTKSQGDRGSINNVNIKNVKVYSLLDSIVSRINGESESSAIRGVTIEGIEIEGVQITSLDQLGLLANQYTSDITITGSQKVLGAYIQLPYELNLANDEVNLTKIENITQEGMLVPDFARMNGDLPYIGSKDKHPYTASTTHGAGNKTSTPSDDGSGDYINDGGSSAYAVDSDVNTVWSHKDWKNEADEFVSLTIDFKEQLITVGVVRIRGNIDNDFFYTYALQVWGRRIKSDGSVNPNYTRIASLKTYQMTPASGNCLDINISTQQYAGLQLRLYRQSDVVTAPKHYEISEVEFYPPSLTFGKAIVDASEHNDVYPVDKVVDGDATGTSYYESKTLPAYFVIDLGNIHSISIFVMCLPPSALWDARTQNIEILGSDSLSEYNKTSTQFKTLVPVADYLFDPATGNRNIIQLTASAQIRYIKVVINSNSIKAGYGAQLSEFSAYES